MKEMKYENSFLIFILINFSVKAQNTSSPFLMRATLGASGSSETVTFDNLNISLGTSYAGYGAIGSDDSVGNYMEWDLNYLKSTIYSFI